MSALPPLNALKAFEAAGRHLNFSHAAQELGVTQGAVAQHVRGLEARLGVTLFERRARGLWLTDDGRRYLPAISRAFELIQEATRDLSSAQAVVTISTTPSFATRWLVPRLGDLAKAHPDLSVRLDASNAPANFQTDGVDIAIRMGKPPFAGLTHELLLSSELIVVCHPDQKAGATPLRDPADLVHHVLLQDTHGQWPLLLQAIFADTRVPDMKTINFSQTALAIDAALAGQGVALANRAFVETELAQNRLYQPFDISVPMDEGYYIVTPRKPRAPKVVADVRRWLIAQTSQNR